MNEKIFDYKDEKIKSYNLLNQINENINKLLLKDYSKNEIKKQFNSMEFYINNFFSYQNNIENYRLTRSLNLQNNSYKFQLEYFDGMRILFESIKNHKFNSDYFKKCDELTKKNNDDKLKLQNLEKNQT